MKFLLALLVLVGILFYTLFTDIPPPGSPSTSTDGSPSWRYISKATSDICSVECGDGFYLNFQRCVDTTGKVVDDSFCPPETKRGAIIVPCRKKDCPWNTPGAWSSCSATCGGSGTKTRTVTCSGPTETDCSSEKPATSETCSVACSPCTNSCGSGNQTRTETCPDCPATGIVTTQTCENYTDCPWTYSAYGECNNSCGKGTKSRTATCSGPTPASCQVGKQTGLTADCLGTAGCVWKTGDDSWTTSACAGPDGSIGCTSSGTKTRNVFCSTPTGTAISSLPEFSGSSDTTICTSTKPAVTTTCSDYTKCSWGTGVPIQFAGSSYQSQCEPLSKCGMTNYPLDYNIQMVLDSTDKTGKTFSLLKFGSTAASLGRWWMVLASNIPTLYSYYPGATFLFADHTNYNLYPVYIYPADSIAKNSGVVFTTNLTNPELGCNVSKDSPPYLMVNLVGTFGPCPDVFLTPYKLYGFGDRSRPVGNCHRVWISYTNYVDLGKATT